MSVRSEAEDRALMRGLPESIDAERFILGSIMLDDRRFLDVAERLTVNDFALESHRRVYARMLDLYQNGDSEADRRIDRVTVANILMRFGELESVGGLSFIVSLDDGLPALPNLDSYVQIVKDKSLLRQIALSAQHTMNRALTGEEDAAEILSSAEASLLNLSEQKKDGGLMTPLEVIQNYPGGINAFLDPAKRTQGVTCGFTKLDDMTGGFHAGEVTILAARPSMGKTAIALNMAWNIAVMQGLPVAIFSLEMSRESLMLRMLCAAARVDSQRFRAGYLNDGERQKLRKAAAEMTEAPFFIDDSSGLTVLEMHAKLRKLQQQNGVQFGLVVLDYLQLMGSKGRSENRNQEVSAMSRGLKLMSKQIEAPFLILSQLNRATETRPGDHRPQLADLRDSGSVEQDADVVAFIFREEVYKRDREDLRGMAELIIAKQRNGPVGTVNLVFLHSMTKFENRAEDLPNEFPRSSDDAREADRTD